MTPLLIGGCERSGTTFLGGLLGGSPSVITLPEGGLRVRVARYFENRTINNPLSETQARELVSKLARSHKFDHFQDSERQAVEALTDKADSPNAVMNVLTNLYRENRGLEKSAHPSLWVEHSPDNLAYAKKLVQAYPDAKFIHIIRDGRAVYNSVKKVGWGPKTPVKAAQWWLGKLSYAFAAEQILKGRVHTVKYEDVLLQPEPTLRGICAFAGIEYTDEMITGDDKFVANYTKAQHEHVGKGSVSSRMDSWKRELSASEITLFEKYSYRMLDLLNYEVEESKSWPAVTLPKKVEFFLTEAYHSLYLNPKKDRARRNL
jgi:hypothetical protein